MPAGHSEMTWLRALVEERAPRRYGTRDAEEVPGAWKQLDHELVMIEQLGFAGYFLIVFDIVEFCRHNDIFCQGRGSAASSAVCYVLGITNADAVTLGLLFERFLSPERDGPPDIDVDIESGRREEVIQYVYGRYGRECVALVAVTVTYRARSAIRDVGKAFGYPAGQVDRWAKDIERWGSLGGHRKLAGDRSGHWSWWSGEVARELGARAATGATAGGGGRPGRDDVAREPLGPGETLEGDGDPAPGPRRRHRASKGFPRHLGIHPGGMVICDRPVAEVCPVEWARMKDRTVLQWDKDDCRGCRAREVRPARPRHARRAAPCDRHRGLVPRRRSRHGDDPPGRRRLRDALPRRFGRGLPGGEPSPDGDLAAAAAEALLRPRRRGGPYPPGPDPGRIGASLHPPAERLRACRPLSIPCRAKPREDARGTAVPRAADGDGDRRRRVQRGRGRPAPPGMGAKRSAARMERLRERLFAGMAQKGITGEIAEEIWDKLRASPNFGFPESHSVSFAYLVYVSAWLKLHYPAAFLAALLNSQPMGFWAPHTLVADARRHGVVVRGPEVAGARRSPRPRAGEPVEARAGRRPRDRLGERDRRRTRRGDRRRTPLPGPGGSQRGARAQWQVIAEAVGKIHMVARPGFKPNIGHAERLECPLDLTVVINFPSIIVMTGR